MCIVVLNCLLSFRMCLCLINCYETFLNGEFPKAIHDVDNLIQTLENAEMNEFFKPIADICFHVVYVTKAFILAYLGDDVIQVIIKQTHVHSLIYIH